jgi:cob(I)alamin adenosyltransferase
MKIYTKTGDDGTTGLFGGKRVKKDAALIEAYGTVDELNSMLGVVRSLNRNKELDQILAKLQTDLFVLSAELAASREEDGTRSIIPRIGEEHVEVLEARIDEIETELSPLKNFLFPAGSVAASHLHLARAVCRRAERRTVKLARREAVGNFVVKYLNRLSDLLFVLARLANKIDGMKEEKWSAR